MPALDLLKAVSLGQLWTTLERHQLWTSALLILGDAFIEISSIQLNLAIATVIVHWQGLGTITGYLGLSVIVVLSQGREPRGPLPTIEVECQAVPLARAAAVLM